MPQKGAVRDVLSLFRDVERRDCRNEGLHCGRSSFKAPEPRWERTFPGVAGTTLPLRHRARPVQRAGRLSAFPDLLTRSGDASRGVSTVG